jgi:hypothetical protein
MMQAQLNALVYQAYGLDAADIAVIEGVVGGRAPGSEAGDAGDAGDDEA